MGLPFSFISTSALSSLTPVVKAVLLPYAAVHRSLVLEKERTSVNVQPSLSASSPTLLFSKAYS